MLRIYRFLKLFAGISYLTYDLGDRKVDGTSVYLKNLNNVLQDIYLEILKQDKITTRKLKLSEPYKIFNPHNFSNIPIIYKKKARIDNIKENKGLNDTLKVKEIKQ